MGKALAGAYAVVAVTLLLPATSVQPATSLPWEASVAYDSTGGTQVRSVTATLAFTQFPNLNLQGPVPYLWSETHGCMSITELGEFAVELGSFNPLPDSLAGRDLWLHAVVNGHVVKPRPYLGKLPAEFFSDSQGSGTVGGDSLVQVQGFKLPAQLNIPHLEEPVPAITECFVIAPCGGWSMQDPTDACTNVCDGMGASFPSSAPGVTATFSAQALIPENATILSLQAYVFDRVEDPDLTFTLHRVSHSMENQPVVETLASVSSSGAVEGWQLLEKPLCFYVGENSDAAFVVELTVPENESPEGTIKWGIVKVCYIMGNPPTGSVSGLLR